MNINRYFWNNLTESEKDKIFNRSELNIDAVKESVKTIVDDVKKEKDKALFKYSKIFDKIDLEKVGLKVSEKAISDAVNKISPELKKAIDFSMKNVEIFHKKQKIESINPFEIRPGVWGGEKAIPIESLGIYVPGGRGKFPSMLYMNLIPAIIAGVKNISIVTPPLSDGSVDPASLYIAHKYKIKNIFKIGGAQAIAALAYGTETIKPVVKITGPGSMYVTAAKRLLYGKVDIGLPAGPSESIIIADKSANPYLLALDLMTEAEHGEDSSAILITDSQAVADECVKNINSLIELLPQNRKNFINKVLSGYGGIILTENLEQSIYVSNQIATEHLKISTKNPEKVANKIVNAGEIIIGEITPFSAANYSIGPNAILPTGGNAKTFSAISVRDFVKYSSIIYLDEKGYKSIYKNVLELAKYEEFDAHHNALKLREK